MFFVGKLFPCLLVNGTSSENLFQNVSKWELITDYAKYLKGVYVDPSNQYVTASQHESCAQYTSMLLFDFLKQNTQNFSLFRNQIINIVIQRELNREQQSNNTALKFRNNQYISFDRFLFDGEFRYKVCNS